MSKTLDDKVVVISGGAGGIGSAICTACAAAGASLVITYNSDAQKAQCLVARLPGDTHMLAHAPVDDSAAVQRLAAQVGKRYGRVDVLVNNAGVSRAVPHDDLDALDDALIDQIFRVNWRGAFAMVRAFTPLLQTNGGVIVNISSVAGQTGVGSNVAYCASKAAMDSMTRSLARALAPRIRVVSVAPGFVEGDYARRMDPAMVEKQRQRTPLQRIATAEDVAHAVLAVAMHLTFTTGCIIPVDGGRPLA